MASECKPVEKFQEPNLSGELRIIEALRLIDAGLNDQRLTVAYLAQELHLSPSRLRQIFTAELGVAPRSYIRKIRLRRARRLLANSSLSVKEVMASVGFDDPSDFSRAYRKFFGVPPSVCKRCHHAQKFGPDCCRLAKKTRGLSI